MKKTKRRPLLALLLALVSIALLWIGSMMVTHFTAEERPAPIRVTDVAHAQESTGITTAKTNLKNCIITLAYVEFLVDGKSHTPKVTITDRGRILKKNTDYKTVFTGGRDAGTSTVVITGIGNYTGTVTKKYKGIAASTTAAKTTKAKATKTTTAAPKKTTAAKTTNAKTTKATTVKPVKTTAAGKAHEATAKETKITKTVPRPMSTAPAATKTKKVKQSIKSMTAYTFPETGNRKPLGAKVSSGLRLIYKSSDPKVVSVNGKGVMQAKKAGAATITIKQTGNAGFKPASRTVKVRVPSFQSRKEAMSPWRHVLIDTFFHINGRKYSHRDPGKYWKSNSGSWSGKTGKKGNTQSCVTLSTVSLKRVGLLSPKSGCVWLSSNQGTKPNKTVRRLKSNSKTLTIYYPHKSLKYLAGRDIIQYGDILCRSGHTFVYMGKDSAGHPLIYESGSRRDIGNGTCVVWGHHSGGHADKLTGKINKQISKSDQIGDRWKQGKVKDEAFRGHRASGKNLNKPIHIVCSIRTFKVKTSCTNGTITPGSIFMAGQKVTIRFSSSTGKPVAYVKVDGKKVKAKSKIVFKKITADHSVEVKFKQ